MATSKVKNELALVNPKDLSLVDENALNPKQLQILLQKTPKQYIKTRPAKGGGTWEYVTGGYIRKCLNLIFGWDWSFEVLDEKIFAEAKEVVVKGRLTCRTNGKTIVKTQFGNKDIICKRGTDIPLSIGNDLKAAATDCLKKCAAEIGIAADIYNKEDFKEVRVIQESVSLEELKEVYNKKQEKISPDDQLYIERIIEEKESESYLKAFKVLQAL